MNLAAIIGGAGALAGGIGALQSAHQQKRLAGAQADIARQQQGLFNQTSPYYQNLLAQQGQYANSISPYYHNPYSDPQAALRLTAQNQQIGHNYNNAADQLSFGLNRRGLQGSSLDVAGRAALLAQAAGQKGAAFQGEVMRQPQEWEHRQGLLANALNPGLGMGQAAGNTFGQQAGMYGQQASAAGAGIGQSIQNYMLQDALHRQNSMPSYIGPQVPTVYPGITTPDFSQEGGNLGKLAELLGITQGRF